MTRDMIDEAMAAIEPSRKAAAEQVGHSEETWSFWYEVRERATTKADRKRAQRMMNMASTMTEMALMERDRLQQKLIALALKYAKLGVAS